jgi:hypothetical protein
VAVKGFKKCCIFSAINGTNDICAMAGRRMEMLGVSVRKMEALTVNMEAVTLIGNGR